MVLRVHGTAVPLATLLLAACAGPAAVGSVDLGGDPIALRSGAGGATPSVVTRVGAVALNGFRTAHLLGAWAVGGSSVLVVRGRTAACATTWDVVAVHASRPEVHTINACERDMHVTATPDALTIASAEATPRVWRFAGDTLLGPLPTVDPADGAARAPAPRRRRTTVADAAPPPAPLMPTPPPSVSQPVGTDVIPAPVGPSHAPPPVVPLQ